MRYIEQYVEVVNAVLILSHGTGTRNNIGTDYMFSAISALFPKTLVGNIAFMFTSILSHFSWNLPQDMVPGALNNVPMFHLNNPIVFSNDVPLPTWISERLLEENALKMLVKLFDWLDSLEPHPVTEIVSLYEKYQNIEAMIINILDQRAVEAEISRLMIHLQVHSAVSLSPCTWRSRLMLVGCRTCMHSPTSRRRSTYPP